MQSRMQVAESVNLFVGEKNQVFGDDGWRELYQQSSQQVLFGESEFERDPGIEGLLQIHKERLQKLFGNRFLDQSRELKNTKNSTLFVLWFCVGSGNKSAIGIAKSIADHILKKL